MAQQTGSISFEAVGGFSAYASGEYATKKTATRLQTAIEQNAENITLRATKAELDALSIGGRNRLVNTGSPTADSPVKGANCSNPPIYGGTVAYADSVGTYTVDRTSAERCVRFVTTAGDTLSLMGLPKSGNFVFSGYIKTSFSNSESRLTVRSQYYAGSWKQTKLKNLLTGEELSGGVIPVIVGSSSEWTRFEVMVTVPDGESPTGFYLSLQEYDENGGGSTAVAGDTFQFKSLKFEKGDRATDWSPAPEDMATAAELKVANDQINLRVEKSGVISSINQSAESIKISADKVAIDGTAVFSAIKGQADAAYDAKGAASTVQTNLDNLAIGGRNYILDSASLSVSGLGSASGSRKEYQLVNVGQSYMGVPSGTQVTLSFDLYMTVNTANPSLLVYNTNNKGPKGFSNVADTIGISTLRFTAAVGTTISERVSVTGYIVDRDSPTLSDNYLEFYSNYGTSNWFSIKNLKLELGNKASDWSPAPEDQTAYVDSISIGGRNLLRCSRASSDNLPKTISGGAANTSFVTEDGYPCYKVTGASTGGFFYGNPKASTDLKVALDADTTYTYSAWIKVTTTASGVSSVPHSFTSLGHHQVYNADSTASDKTHEDVVAKRAYAPETVNIGEWTYISEQFTTNSLGGSLFGKYAKHALGDAYTVFVRDMKLERGNRATDWTPAPEDVDDDISSAESSAKEYSDKLDAITVLSSGYKKFKNPAHLDLSGNYTGALVIVTPILPNHMVTLRINGYNYTGGNETIDIEVGFYNYTTNFHQYGYLNYGSRIVTPIRLAKVSSSDKRAVVIIGDEGSTWHYPKISVSEAMVSYGSVPDSYADGWSMSIEGTYPSDYIELTDVNGSNFKSEIASATNTANAAAPKANAVKRTQRIWYRSNSATKPATPSAWVTKEDDGTGAWTKMHVAITSTHKYIYTCEQSEKADGTVGYTAVLRDNTITVIDGGNVITHSIVADKLDADSVKANIVQTTTILAEQMKTNLLNAMDAVVSDLKAINATIGGFAIDDTSIRSGALNSTASGAVALAKSAFSRAINGTARSLMLAIGSKFGVGADGTLYASGATVDGTVTATAGTIGGASIVDGVLKVKDANVDGKILANHLDVSSIAIGDLDGGSTVVSNASNGKSAYDRHTAYRGTCSTAAGTAAKVVACTGFALATGATVEVYCSTANTANVPTLNVNSTGAKPIWINGAVASASNPCKWLAGDTVTFTYDGTRFRASLPVEGYVTEGTGGGLMVHRKSDATTGVQITDSVDVMRNGVSVAMFGTDGSGNALSRIGPAASSHTEQTADGFIIYTPNSTDVLIPAVKIQTSEAADHSINGRIYLYSERSETYIDTTSNSFGSFLWLCSDNSAEEARSGFPGVGLKAIDRNGDWARASLYKDDTTSGFVFRVETDVFSVYADEVQFPSSSIDSAALKNVPTTKITGTLDVDHIPNMNASKIISGVFAEELIPDIATSKLYGTIADANLPTKGSAGTAGTSSATSGATLAVPYITTDAYGRVTAKGTHTHTIGSLAASAVTSGTFNAARIPNLDASKINAGTFDAARIPSLNASKINDGTLDSARLPTVPVDKGGTGQTGVEKTTDIAAAMSAASGVTISAAQVATWGKVMQVLITAKATAAKSGTWTVGTMTAGHRPELVTFGTSNLAAIEQCRMGTDGAVSVAGTLAANASVSLTFTYLLA